MLDPGHVFITFSIDIPFLTLGILGTFRPAIHLSLIMPTSLRKEWEFLYYRAIHITADGKSARGENRDYALRERKRGEDDLI
jgi:hypothetical protein